MTTATKEPTALQCVDDALAAIRSARINAGAAIAAKKQAAQDARQAHEERMEALEDAARGDEDAMARAEEAHHQCLAAQAAAEVAQAADEAARRVIEQEGARIQRLRERHWPEFAEDAERTVAEVQTTAEALVEPLRRYLAKRQEAAAKWNALGPATLKRRLEADREAGRVRDMAHLYREVEIPPSPIDPGAVAAVVSVLPRPRFLQPPD